LIPAVCNALFFMSLIHLVGQECLAVRQSNTTQLKHFTVVIRFLLRCTQGRNSV
jgi:hypothetical protein